VSIIHASLCIKCEREIIIGTMVRISTYRTGLRRCGAQLFSVKKMKINPMKYGKPSQEKSSVWQERLTYKSRQMPSQ
jgi:ribosomal protein L37E